MIKLNFDHGIKSNITCRACTFSRTCLRICQHKWSPHQQHLIDKIERIQKLAARFIYCNYSRHSNVTNLINRANLQPLYKRRIISRLKFLYLLYHGHFKILRALYLQDPFKHSLRTNHNKVILQPASRVNTNKYSLFPMAICNWNKLPVNAVNCSTLESFLNCLEQIDFFWKCMHGNHEVSYAYQYFFPFLLVERYCVSCYLCIHSCKGPVMACSMYK